MVTIRVLDAFMANTVMVYSVFGKNERGLLMNIGRGMSWLLGF